MSRRVRVRAAALWVRAQAAAIDAAIFKQSRAGFWSHGPLSAAVGEVVGARARLAPPRGASAPPLRRKMPS